MTPKDGMGTRIEGMATEEEIQEKNSKLDEIAVIVREGLFDIKRMGDISFVILVQEVTHGLRTKITDIAPKSERQLFLSRLQKTIINLHSKKLSGCEKLQ